MADTDELLARLAQLEARITELEQQPDPAPPPDQSRLTRRALFGLAGAGAAGLLMTDAAPAAAADGDPLLLGQENNATSATTLTTPAGFAVDANTGGGTAIEAIGDSVGVRGEGDEWGIRGESMVVGGTGVFGAANEAFGFGVYASADQFLAVTGVSISGVGGAFACETGPQVILATNGGLATRSPLVGPPPDFNFRGALAADDDGDLWFCTADGEPGTWTRLNQQGPRFLPTPARGYDSRPSFEPTTGPQGWFAAGETRTVDLSATGIPGNATGVIVNVAVTGTSGAGYVSIAAGDATLALPPSFATVNWTESGQTTSNTTSVGVHEGTVKVYAHRATHVILDVIAAYA